MPLNGDLLTPRSAARENESPCLKMAESKRKLVLKSRARPPPPQLVASDEEDSVEAAAEVPTPKTVRLVARKLKSAPIRAASSGEEEEEEEEVRPIPKPAKPKSVRRFTQTITITYGECAENHVGMQKLGQKAARGLTLAQLEQMRDHFDEQGYETELVMLAEAGELPDEHLNSETREASVLIIRNGVSAVLKDIIGSDDGANDMYDEQNVLDVDKKAFMKGRVVNKHARYNLCFDEEPQEPNYEEKQGRVIAFSDVPLTDAVRNFFVNELNLGGLKAEGNYYYEPNCGIGWHGDSERRIVIAVRLGRSMPLHYRWYHNRVPIGQVVPLMLHHGDIYLMSAKAVGTDWLKYTQVTLRHAAGGPDYLKPK